VGGQIAALVRIVGMIVVPLGILGLIWGYTERATLERNAKAGLKQFDNALRRYVWRQVGKAISCGLAFGIFTYSLGYVEKFAPWNDLVDVMANILQLLGWALLAVPVGLIVGMVSRQNLMRRLSARGGNTLPP
jgi:predicted PurR-regulated permease PerM